MNVTKIELIDGNSGERKTIESKNEVGQILNDIKDLVLAPENDQEGSVGYVNIV